MTAFLASDTNDASDARHPGDDNDSDAIPARLASRYDMDAYMYRERFRGGCNLHGAPSVYSFCTAAAAPGIARHATCTACSMRSESASRLRRRIAAYAMDERLYPCDVHRGRDWPGLSVATTVRHEESALIWLSCII